MIINFNLLTISYGMIQLWLKATNALLFVFTTAIKQQKGLRFLQTSVRKYISQHFQGANS